MRRTPFASPPPCWQRDASQGWGLEANPNRLQVQTIDSLCVGLADRLPLLSRLGPAPQIQEDAWALYREAARETLALLEEDGYTEQVAALLLHLDNDVAAAEALLAGLLAKRDQWWRHLRGGAQRAELERALENLSRERMEQAREAVPEVFVEAILAAVRYAAANVARANPASPLAACADVTGAAGCGPGGSRALARYRRAVPHRQRDSAQEARQAQRLPAGERSRRPWSASSASRPRSRPRSCSRTWSRIRTSPPRCRRSGCCRRRPTTSGSGRSSRR